MKPKRILVTGGAGFIGTHTVNQLLDEGHHVVVLDNLSSGSITNLTLHRSNLEFVEGDVLEYLLVVDLLKDCDAVLHLAAIASVPFSIENPIYSFQVNTQGLLHVIEAIRKADRPIRLVYASSAAVYGNATNLPCHDNGVLSSPPLSPYALQKIDDESYAALYARLHGVSSLALRYFNVYGPGQDPCSPYSGVISRFLEGYRSDQELVIYGDGQQSRDFVHVMDVARANVLALHSDYQGVLNIATGQPETLLDLLRYIEAAGTVAVRYRLEAARPGDILSSYGATQLAEMHLGFKSEVSLRQGIKEMLG